MTKRQGSVSLRGPAAKAMVESLMGKPATTDEERVERILAHIEAGLKDGTKKGRLSAAVLILTVAKRGLEEACALITARAKPVVDEAAPVTAWCPYAPCSKGFREAELRDGETPYHDYPPPFRMVCQGAKQPPLRTAPAPVTSDSKPL